MSQTKYTDRQTMTNKKTTEFLKKERKKSRTKNQVMLRAEVAK